VRCCCSAVRGASQGFASWEDYAVWWWDTAHRALVEAGLTRARLVEAVGAANVQLRQGCEALLQLIQRDRRAELVVVSAGVTDVIELLLGRGLQGSEGLWPAADADADADDGERGWARVHSNRMVSSSCWLVLIAILYMAISAPSIDVTPRPPHYSDSGPACRCGALMAHSSLWKTQRRCIGSTRCAGFLVGRLAGASDAQPPPWLVTYIEGMWPSPEDTAVHCFRTITSRVQSKHVKLAQGAYAKRLAKDLKIEEKVVLLLGDSLSDVQMVTGLAAGTMPAACVKVGYLNTATTQALESERHDVQLMAFLEHFDAVVIGDGSLEVATRIAGWMISPHDGTPPAAAQPNL
jgi:hypothetical protein